MKGVLIVRQIMAKMVIEERYGIQGKSCKKRNPAASELIRRAGLLRFVIT